MQIFRQVMDGRAYFVMDGMAFPVGRTAQGDEDELMPCSFEAQQFLRDKRFRKAWITFSTTAIFGFGDTCLQFDLFTTAKCSFDL